METVPADYGKRVYQGVRVKHTVKDLLAEKRLRQTSSSRLNGSLATTQSSFVPLAAKPFAYDSPTVQGYPSLLDTHFIDQYADPRTTSISSGASSLFSASSPLMSVMPSFPSDSAQFLSRDSWEQAMPDSLGQSDGCPPDSLQAPSITAGCLSSHEPGVSSQYRNPNWNSPISGTQSYTFHALDDVHYAAGYSATSPYPFSSFMSTVASDLTPKMLQTSSEESSDTAALPDNSYLWPKEDGSPLWGSYECRRTY